MALLQRFSDASSFQILRHCKIVNALPSETIINQ